MLPPYLSKPVLVSILEDFAITVDTSEVNSNNEVQINCFFKHHDDDVKHMSIDVAKSTYHCYGCGSGGGYVDFLKKHAGLDDSGVTEYLEKHGYKKQEIVTKATPEKEDYKKKLCPIIPEQKPVGKKRLIYNKVIEYNYYDRFRGNNLAFKIVQFQKGDQITFAHYTLLTNGMWYKGGALSEELPIDEGCRVYPLYGGENINESDEQVWVVEGEQCVEALRRLQNLNKTNLPPIVHVINSGSWDQNDITLLDKKTVVIISSADTPGRKRTISLGKYLAENRGCIVKYVLLEGETTYNVADKIKESNNDIAIVVAWLKEKIVTHGDLARHEERARGGSIEQNIVIPDRSKYFENNKFFKVLGTQPNDVSTNIMVVIQNKRNWETTVVPHTQLSQMRWLLGVAPIEWWIQLNNGQRVSGNTCQDFASNVVDIALSKSKIDVNANVFGRGAHESSWGKIYYNVGDKVLSGGRRLTHSQNFDETEDVVFTAGPKIIIKEDPDAITYCQDLVSAVMAYRWLKPEHGKAFLGWIVSALVGGALEFRPGMWILGKQGSGKTYLLDKILKPLLDDFLVECEKSATPAAIAASTKSDAIALYMEENEPDNNLHQRNNQNQVLSLMRVSTGGGAKRMRGTREGGLTAQNLRFSMMACSIRMPILDQASASRIVTIKLDPKSVKDWVSTELGLQEALLPEKCLAIRSHIIMHSPLIVGAIKDMKMSLLREDNNVQTRRVLTNAALSIGYSFLLDQNLMHPETFEIETTEENDKYELIDEVLRLQVKTPEDGEMLLAQVLTSATATYETVLVNMGIKRDVTEEEVYISLKIIKSKLKGTLFEYVNLKSELESMSGIKIKERQRIGNRQYTCAVIPKEVFAEVGLDLFDQSNSYNNPNYANKGN